MPYFCRSHDLVVTLGDLGLGREQIKSLLSFYPEILWPSRGLAKSQLGMELVFNVLNHFVFQMF